LTEVVKPVVFCGWQISTRRGQGRVGPAVLLVRREFSDIDSLASEQLEMDIETFLDEDDFTSADESHCAVEQLAAGPRTRAARRPSCRTPVRDQSATDLSTAYYAQ
jgi:hypothetical protein